MISPISEQDTRIAELEQQLAAANAQVQALLDLLEKCEQFVGQCNNSYSEINDVHLELEIRAHLREGKLRRSEYVGRKGYSQRQESGHRDSVAEAGTEWEWKNHGGGFD